MSSPKYNRTLHLPWSPGKGSDDKVATSVESLLKRPIIITEKIDGSNASLEFDGCFARTHSGPPTHLSFDGLKALHAQVKHNIPKNIQIFGEWCYALHSISYDKLPDYFLMFGIRELDKREDTDLSFWYAWGELKEWALDFKIPTVPSLWEGTVSSEKELKVLTEKLVSEPSAFGTTREGVVIRIADVFSDSEFSNCVMKYVRANHVQTDEHWKDQEIIRNKLVSIK